MNRSDRIHPRGGPHGPHMALIATFLLAIAFPHPAGAQWKQGAPKSAQGPEKAVAEIRAFFDEYLRLHAAKDMPAWQALFLPEAVCVRTADDGKVIIYRPADLAQSIAEEAAKLESQHETLEDVRIEVEGDAGAYSTLWKLYQNGEWVRQGRAWYSLVRKDGKWRIAALVWYRQSGSGVR